MNGLITEAVTLLKNDAKRRRQLQERFKHILVDEFQDTNIAQLELLHLLSAERRNIVVVGDNDQAIYRFRGASFGSFKLFLQRFAGWKEGQDSTPYRVALMDNYRSTPNILRVATQAIGMNEVSPEFPKKVLQPNKSEGEKIRIAEMETPEDEAAWVADELERSARCRAALAGFRGALPAARASRRSGGTAFAAQDSVCDQQAVHPGASTGARCAGISATDCHAV